MTISPQKQPFKVLQLDSDTAFATRIIQTLESEGLRIKVDEINSRKQLTDKLQKKVYDLVFLSDNAIDCSGIDALKAVKKLKVYTPVIMFSDILDEETIVNYLALGVSDYILKSSLHRLTAVVKRTLSNTRNAKIVDYQNFFETASDLLCTLDGEGHFMGINRAWGEVFGFTDAELIDKPFIQFVCPEDQKLAAAQFQKLFDAKNKSADIICRFQAHSGEIKWLHWKMKLQASGGINAIVRDITEFRLREIQLFQAHQNMQKLVEIYKEDIVKKTLVADQIRDSVVVTDLKGEIVSWNKGSEKIFGYSPAEAVGQHIAMIYPEEDYKYIQEEASNVLLEQGEKEFELRMRRKSGEVFEARLTLEVTRDNNGKVNGMLGYAIDMGPVRPLVDEAATAQIVEVNASLDELENKGHQQQADTGRPDEQPVGQSLQQSLQQSPQEPEPVVELQAPVEPELQVPVESEVVKASEEHVREKQQKPVEQPEQGEQQQQVKSAENAGNGEQMKALETSTPEVQHESETTVPESPAKVFVPPVKGTGITIMYLEDSLNHINRVEKILAERQDYRLLTTQEPEDCIDMAKQYLPSLILLDMDLPESDGVELLNKLQGDSSLKHIPVIAVGTDSSEQAAQSARRSGFSEYLVKPVDGSVLLQTIDSIFYSDGSKAVGSVS